MALLKNAIDDKIQFNLVRYILYHSPTLFNLNTPKTAGQIPF